MRLNTQLQDTHTIVNTCIKDTGCAFGGWPEKYQQVCPIFAQGRHFTASLGGIVYLIRALIEGNIPFSQQIAEHAYTCSQCKACDISCYVLSIHREDIKPSDFVRLLRSQLVKRGILPEGVLRDMYASVKAEGTLGTASVLQLPVEVADPSAESILYVEGFTTPGQQDIFTAASHLVMKSGHKMALLNGKNCGSACYDLGFWEELKPAMDATWNTMKSLQEKTLVFLDPHHYEFVTKRYPEFIEGFTGLKTMHFSEYLLESLKKGVLRTTTSDRLKVSYHDPCSLGRGMGIYDTPREILRNMDGIELIEMNRSRETAFCCGAWSFGNYYPNMSQETAKLRLEECASTGADVLVTACPNCKEQFQKILPEGQKERVQDLAELINARTS